MILSSCVCVSVCVGSFSQLLYTWFLRHGLSLTLVLADWVGLLAREHGVFSCFHTPVLGPVHNVTWMLGTQLRSCACEATPSPTEPTPKPSSHSNSAVHLFRFFDHIYLYPKTLF